MNKKINSQYLIFSKTENDEIHYENLIFKKKNKKKMSEKQIYFFCSKKTTPQPFNI